MAIFSATMDLIESLDASFSNKLVAIAARGRRERDGSSAPSDAVNGFGTTSVRVAEWSPPRQIGDGAIRGGGQIRDRSVSFQGRYHSKEERKSNRMVVRRTRRRDVNPFKAWPECRRRGRLGRYRRRRRRARPGPTSTQAGNRPQTPSYTWLKS